MKKPRIKRNRPTGYSFVTAPTIPVDEFMNHCPLPAELAYLEPIMRGDFGQNLLTSIMACHSEGFTHDQLKAVIRQLVDFYGQEWQRCNACHGWAKEFTAGAMVIDGRFMITVICPECAALGQTGRHTAAMTRNMQEFITSGGAA